MADPSRIRVAGPFKAFATGFATELLRQGYTPDSARLQMYLLAHLSRWLAAEGLGAGGLSTAAVGRFLDGLHFGPPCGNSTVILSPS